MSRGEPIEAPRAHARSPTVQDHILAFLCDAPARPGSGGHGDNEGHLATVTDSSGSSSYIYDADGSRLIAKDPNCVTAYLPGFELRKVGSTVTATRNYSGVAARTPPG